MVQFLSITFLLLNFFNFCWVFQKFPFFCVTRSLKTDQDDLSTCTYNKAIYIYIYIQGVTGGKDQTSGGCSLC